MRPTLITILALGLLPAAGHTQSREPLEVARTLAARYPTSTEAISYIPALSWIGAVQLAAIEDDVVLVRQALVQISPFLTGQRPAITEPYRLTSLAGTAALLELDDPTGHQIARMAGEEMLPDDPAELVAHATGWTDDMYMAVSLLGRLAMRTGDARYADALGRILVHYAERLQRPDGLFVHAEDAPFPWGRGNGFAATGLMEGLSFLPPNRPDRAPILASFRAQMAALLEHQSDDGSWHQVVDVPTSYRELTVTALTVRAMARGVRSGWLDRATYLPAIERGWAAIASRVAEDGTVRDACTSTAAGETLQYYLDRPTVNGIDDRAGGLVLLAAIEFELLRRS